MKTSKRAAPILLAILTLAACVDGPQSPATARLRHDPGMKYLSSKPEAVRGISEAPQLARRPEVLARLRAAEEKYYWVHQLHSIAVREMIVAQLKRSEKDRNDPEKRCELAIKVSLRAYARARVMAGERAQSNQENWADLRPGALRSKCREQAARHQAGGMSIFTPSFASAALAPQSSEFQYWSGVLQSAYDNAGGNGVAITDAMAGVMNNAYAALSESDYMALAEFANLLMQSAVDWQTYYAYQQSTGGGGGGDPCGSGSPYAGGPGCDGGPMSSIFKPRQDWVFVWVSVYYALRSVQVSDKARTVALADFVGGLAAAAAASPIAWPAVLGWAAIASVAAY